MKTLLASLGIVALLLAGGLYYQFVYPPSVLERSAEEALQAFADAVATKDRAKISEAFSALLTDDAKIHLEVSFFAVIETNANKPMVQDFDKAGFIQFIDNTLYPLSDYGYTPLLEEFTLAPDHQTAAVKFSSREWGDGASMFGGVSVDMRYSSDTKCDGQVVFVNEQPRLSNASCALTLRTVPKPGQYQKLQGSTDAMQQYLQR